MIITLLSSAKTIKKQLMPIAWHPSDGGVSVCHKMKNKEVEKLCKADAKISYDEF